MNRKYNKAKDLHKKIELILLGCKVFEGTDQYSDIIDSLTRTLKALNELKISVIKG